MTWLGIDIGGANLKLANGAAWSQSVPFPLWKEPDGLAPKLIELLAAAPLSSRLAVTMTGELCDCFRSKVEGVRHILAAVNHAAGGRDVRVYLVGGGFISLDEAGERPQLAAASNWHALAQFACRFVRGGAGLLVDIGSTTTDIVPLVNQKPTSHGTCDTDRLACGELVYTGVGRTPICAVTHRLPWRECSCVVAAELFATMADVYVLLRESSERPEVTSTADGRPRTIEFARERLARMICADTSNFTMEDARRAAKAARHAQIGQIQDALDQVLGRLDATPQCIVSSGAGEFIIRECLAGQLEGCAVLSFGEQFGEEISLCAPAHAVAVLAREAYGE